MHLKDNAPSVASHGRTVIGFNWIGGREVEGDLPSFDSRSPVDSRDTVGIFPECGERDVEKAARAAAHAFPAWNRVPAHLRGDLVGRIGEALATHKDKLAAILTREVGKPPREAQAEVMETLLLCRNLQEEGRHPRGRIQTGGLVTYPRPLGVVAVMTGGGLPLSTPAAWILSAILEGNTVVWKPSEDAPTIAYLLARCMMDAGLPPGVVNILNGKGRNGCGRFVVAGLDRGFFQKICFSGATALGRTIAEAAGRGLMTPTLELRARNPLVVMPDCRLEEAVKGALLGAFASAGQRHTSVGNLLVHADVYDAFRAAFLKAVAGMEVGNPVTHPDVFYGPMINARCAKAFEEHWAAGAEEGASLLCGGARWTEENRTERVKGAIAKGHFMQACVWEGVTPQMRLFQAELRGPAVNLCRVESFDEAMAWANATPHSHASGLYTGDRNLAERFKREILAGSSFINGAPFEGGPEEASFARNYTVSDGSQGPSQPALTHEDIRHTYDPSHWDKL